MRHASQGSGCVVWDSKLVSPRWMSLWDNNKITVLISIYTVTQWHDSAGDSTSQRTYSDTVTWLCRRQHESMCIQWHSDMTVQETARIHVYTVTLWHDSAGDSTPQRTYSDTVTWLCRRQHESIRIQWHCDMTLQETARINVYNGTVTWLCRRHHIATYIQWHWHDSAGDITSQRTYSDTVTW
jgi:hypothetical protein